MYTYSNDVQFYKDYIMNNYVLYVLLRYKELEEKDVTDLLKIFENVETKIYKTGYGMEKPALAVPFTDANIKTMIKIVENKSKLNTRRRRVIVGNSWITRVVDGHLAAGTGAFHFMPKVVMFTEMKDGTRTIEFQERLNVIALGETEKVRATSFNFPTFTVRQCWAKTPKTDTVICRQRELIPITDEFFAEEVLVMPRRLTRRDAKGNLPTLKTPKPKFMRKLSRIETASIANRKARNDFFIKLCRRKGLPPFYLQLASQRGCTVSKLYKLAGKLFAYDVEDCLWFLVPEITKEGDLVSFINSDWK